MTPTKKYASRTHLRAFGRAQLPTWNTCCKPCSLYRLQILYSFWHEAPLWPIPGRFADL